jgi:broad specificity phosphatase PhoE
VRHGETLYNTEHRITGQSDIALNSVGEQQAALIGAYLAKETIDIIVSSDLQRTRATARAIAQARDIPLYEDSDLREIAMGEWEGFTIKEIEQRFPDTLVPWRTDAFNYGIPHGGENLRQVNARITRALSRWQSEYADKTVVWVTHGGFIGLLVCNVLDLDIRRRWQFRHDNASLTEIWLKPERAILARLNETAHLVGMRHVEGAEA